MENIQFNLTELNKMMAFLESSADKNSEEYKIFHAYTELQKKRFCEEQQETGKPFLSIITRTQGKRPDMLTETLLCLTGQTDTDFELILAGHNLDSLHRETVEGIISELPGWMQERTRYLPVDGGTRTTPLIKGFEAANGRYVAVLDDDDTVFDNWVASFREAAERAPGKILHSYCLYQEWETVGSILPNTPISMHAPSSVFCSDFSMPNELTKNCCPLMSLAFPAYMYKVLNVRFDEALTTTEDWDFLMRTAFICGVENINHVTCIYRNWLNAENSQTLHNKDEWDNNYNKIVDRFKELPAFYDKNSMNALIEASADSNAKRVVCTGVQMYYDDGFGFEEANTVRASFAEEKGWTNEFGKLSSLGELSAIRIDPNDSGHIVVEDFKLRIEFADKTVKDYSVADVKTNAYTVGKQLVFLKNDPQILLTFDKPQKIERVICNLDITTPVPDSTIDGMVSARRSIFYRTLRKLWRKLKRVFGK